MDSSVLWDDNGDLFQEAPQPLRASWDPMTGSAPADTPKRPAREPRKTKRRSSIGWFVHRYGWRAYGIPILLAATVLAILQMTNQPTTATASPSLSVSTPVMTTVVSGVTSLITMPPQTVTVPAEPVVVTESVTEKVTAPGTGQEATPSSGQEALDPNQLDYDLPTGKLPNGAEFTKAGDKTWTVVPGTSDRFGKGSKKLTYSVEIEDGVAIDGGAEAFGEYVDKTLADPRSWTSPLVGDFSLQRVDPAKTEPDFRVSLTSQMTTRELCGYSIKLESSCYYSPLGRVLINDARWVRGAASYSGDLASYRQYALNHEVGHALGFRHQQCGTDGGLAPIMMQQSWSTANDDLAVLDPQNIEADDKVCNPNPFPDPSGGTGKPVELLSTN